MSPVLASAALRNLIFALIRAARRLVRAVKVEDRGLARDADLRQGSRRELLPHSHTHAQRGFLLAHRARAESSTAAECEAEEHRLHLHCDE